MGSGGNLNSGKQNIITVSDSSCSEQMMNCVSQPADTATNKEMTRLNLTGSDRGK